MGLWYLHLVLACATATQYKCERQTLSCAVCVFPGSKNLSGQIQNVERRKTAIPPRRMFAQSETLPATDMVLGDGLVLETAYMVDAIPVEACAAVVEWNGEVDEIACEDYGEEIAMESYVPPPVSTATTARKRSRPGVHFALLTQVETFDVLVETREEKASIWYTEEEVQSFKRDADETVAAMHEMNPFSHIYDPSSRFCTHGLEQLKTSLHSEQRSAAIEAVQWAVFMEQHRQYTEGVEDEAQIARVSAFYSRCSREAAIRRGGGMVVPSSNSSAATNATTKASLERDGSRKRANSAHSMDGSVITNLSSNCSCGNSNKRRPKLQRTNGLRSVAKENSMTEIESIMMLGKAKKTKVRSVSEPDRIDRLVRESEAASCHRHHASDDDESSSESSVEEEDDDEEGAARSSPSCASNSEGRSSFYEELFGKIMSHMESEKATNARGNRSYKRQRNGNNSFSSNTTKVFGSVWDKLHKEEVRETNNSRQMRFVLTRNEASMRGAQ